jgi:hypothetical protein
MLSFIIPAHNEQLLLGRTVGAATEMAWEVAEPKEIIVGAQMREWTPSLHWPDCQQAL